MPPTASPVLPSRWRLVTLAEVDSTNAEAMRRAAAGEAGPLWIRAGAQTTGRGRSGRSWHTVPGNLFASALTTLDCPPEATHQVSLLAGVAVIDALRAACGGSGASPAGLRLKWPNDVLIGAAKLAGILPESAGGATRGGRIVVIGIGINLAGHPEGLGREATHLAAHGIRLAPDLVLRHLALALDDWLGRWDGGRGFAAVRSAWLERAGPAGEPISVHTGRTQIAGTYLGIDAGGALLLRDADGMERRFTYGDVALGTAGDGAAERQ